MRVLCSVRALTPSLLVRYNHIAAQILLNLITSRGEGVDSLLHSENFRFAMKSVHHLLEACFHTPGLLKVLCDLNLIA